MVSEGTPKRIEYYKQLFMENKTPVLVADAKSLEIIDYNKAVIEVFSISDKRVIKGKHLLEVDFYYPKLRDVLGTYIDMAINRGEVLFETELVKADGKKWDAEVQVVNIDYAKQKILLICFRNITSYKHNEKLLLLANEELRAAYEQLTATEEELRQQFEELEKIQMELRVREEKYRNLVESIDCIIFECDYKRIITYISPVITEILGYEVHEVLGRDYFEVLHPEDKPYLYKLFSTIRESKEVISEDYRLLAKWGEYRWVRNRTKVFWEGDRFIVARGVIFDIHEQKIQEERIKYLSIHDNLTGLKNRSYWEEKLQELQDRADTLPLSIIVADINGLKEINDSLGHDVGNNILITTGQLFKRIAGGKGIVARIGGDEFGLLLPLTDEDSVKKIVEEIIAELEILRKEDYLLDLSVGVATKHKKEEDIYNILFLSERRMYDKKLLQSRSTRSHLVLSLLNVMSENTHETKEHCERLAALGSKVAEKMGLKDYQIEKLKILSTIHDIGKIAIPQHILGKPGRLNMEEWQEMKKHAEIGYRITKNIPEFSHVAHEILSHHERWDGKGYPQGLRGTEIPLESRILAVVDAYDAMTSDRVYRKAMSIDKAIGELLNNAGTQFDPFVVDIFVNKVLKEKENKT